MKASFVDGWSAEFLINSNKFTTEVGYLSGNMNFKKIVIHCDQPDHTFVLKKKRVAVLVRNKKK